jgi:hypothetical protein
MDKKPTPPLPPPNPLTARQHHREVFLEIILPLLGGTVFIVVLAILIVGSTPAQASVGADTALIWLIIPLFLLGLIGLAILIFLVVLVTRLLEKTPPYARLVQENINLMSQRLHHAADLSVEPFLRFHSALAIVQKLLARR